MENNVTKSDANFQRDVRLKILNCIFLVFLADWLFFEQAVGWTIIIFAAAALIVFSLHHSRVVSRQPAAIIVALICGLLLAIAENPNTPAIVLTCLAAIGLVLTRNGDWADSAVKFFIRLGILIGQFWKRIFKDISLWYRLRKKQNSRGGHFFRTARNWLVPAILSVAFIFLFTVANPVIGKWIDLMDLRFFFEFLFPLRIFYWGLILIPCWAFVRYRTGGSFFDLSLPSENSIAAFRDFLITPGSITRGLIVFNAIFLVQSGLDIIYLWGGKALPEGLTYADYAHRGAYPLIATALLAGAFVLVALRPGSEPEKSLTIRTLVYLWIFQNIFLVISCLWRMHLYVEIYSLTLLRVSAIIWMFLVGTGLLWITLRIANKKSGAWLINANALTLLTTLYLCGFVNFGGFIAQYNVEHCLEISGKGQPLDLEYFRELGPDTIPALQWFGWRVWSDWEKAEAARKMENEFGAELKNSLKNWRNWTFRKHRLSQGFNEMQYGEVQVSES